MEGEAAAAILQVLVQNLIDSLKKEISKTRDLEKDAKKLTAHLDTIQKFLNDAAMRNVSNAEAVRSWLKRLEDAAFDADHVLDKLNYHYLSKESIKNHINHDKKKKKVLSCFSAPCKDYLRRRKMAIEIKEIRENLDSINKEATELGLQLHENAPDVPDVGFETDSYSDVPIFIGRDGVVSDIVKKILTTTEERVDSTLSTLSIVGMGGLGKTTLTRKVFNHEKIETQFGSRIWVHVSLNFDPIVLLKKILKELSPDDKAESRQDTLRKLSECLKDKTYLLVLDDIWNEDPLKWENFMNGLKGVTSTKGNSIVVTTRNTNVGSTVNPLCMHQLEGLSEEDCWSIIKEKSFGKGEDVVPSPDLESIGRRIAKRCQGSPLAANVVGGVLQRDKSQENWLSIEEKWLPDKEGEYISKILRLSFDSLSSPSLKKCFAYCSMFPKGYKMKKQGVIEQWMAEGFLQPDDRSNDDMESVGEKFINILLNNSLLQVAERDHHGNVESCSMHDLVHDLAHSVSDGSRVRYMLLDGKSSSIDRRDENKYFRTLLLMGGGISPGFMFSLFEGLHVLTLWDIGVVELPSSIKKLIHLRKLNISSTSISHLPEWIGELHYLQTLRAESDSLKKLPSTMKYLINIRHLYLDEDVVLPAEIGRLTSLQTLRYFSVGDEEGCSNIAELGSLNNLKGELTISHLERVLNKEEAKKANLFRKSRISELSLIWDYEDREGEIKNDEEVLEGLQAPADLKELKIFGFKGKRFPAWTLKMAVQNVPPQGSWIGLNKLIEIRLLKCSECEEIPMMGHLPNLKTLWLYKLSNVKRIDSSVYGLAYKDTPVVFPALESLMLYHMPKLAEWAEVESSDVKVFPRLQYLTIKNCKQLMSVPTHSSSCLEELEISNVGSSMDVANIFRIKYAMLTQFCLQGMDDLEYLPDWLFNENPNLKKLEIRECPKLRELPLGLRTLSSSLKELNIENCPCLERIAVEYDGGALGSSFFFFTSLRRITINNCDALACLPCELVGSSLEELELESLSSLKNLPSLVDCMVARSSSRLRRLKVVGVPRFMATCTSSRVEVWGPFRSLRELDIEASTAVEGSMETVDGILQGCCQSLCNLTLRGMEDCDSLPESIQRLTASFKLKLENFGMEELPEWFGNLSSSLWRLELCNCKKLRRLPSMDAMRRLQGLRFLYINGCPELVAQGVADPQWPKISHIRWITIDGTHLNAAAVN